jgi:hypothetical protein
MRAKEFLLSTVSSLFEVKMNPTNLSKLASKIDAKVGIEFEMIIPDIFVRSEDDYPENDMDQDIQASSIEDIIDFFSEDNNDYRYLRKLKNKLQDDYDLELDNIVGNKWDEEGKKYFKKWVRENVPEYEVANTLNIEYDDKDKIKLTKKQWNEFTELEWKNKSHNYNIAYDKFKKELIDNEITEEDVLREMGIEWMSDVYDRYDIEWPYQVQMGDDPEEVFEKFAYDLEKYVSYNVEYSTQYHGNPKSDDTYMIEPDSSISPDDVGVGIEIVSPPLPLEEVNTEIKNVINWAYDNDAYTNSSTGLHINISIPGYNIDKLDFVKLVLFSGDDYVLEQFDRVANTFAVSALDKINEFVTEEDKELFFKALKGKLNNIASKIFHIGKTDKYTSINVKDDYVEIRSPGGNWLDKDINEIMNTIHRYIVALDIALDSTKYQEEYLKKLTKLFSPKRNSIEEIFIQYASGKLTKQALKKSLLANKQQRDSAKLKEKGIIIKNRSNVEPGDWFVEQPIPDDFSNIIILKHTQQVNTGEDALNAALKVSKLFDLNRLEEITATQVDKIKKYRIFEKGLPFKTDIFGYGYTKLDAINEVLSILGRVRYLDLDARVFGETENFPDDFSKVLIRKGEPIFVILLDDFYPKATVISGKNENIAIARATLYFNYYRIPYLDNIKIYTIEQIKKGENVIHKAPVLYIVINSKNSNQQLVAATSKKEAKFIANALYEGLPESFTLAIPTDVNEGRATEIYLTQMESLNKQGIINKFNNIKLYKVREKGAQAIGKPISATSPEEAIKKIKHLIPWTKNMDLEAIPYTGDL